MTRADNLFEPAPGDEAAHGRFDAEAQASVDALSGTQTRAAIALGAGMLALGALWLAGQRKTRRLG